MLSFSLKSKSALLLVLVICFFQMACQSGTKTNAVGQAGPDISGDDYLDRIERNTKTVTHYEGFYNKFQAFATFQNTDVQTFILQKRSSVYQWDIATAQKEREKLFQENSTQTQFFLTLYTPSPRLNDLHKSTSIWKLYLEVNGQRYEGKALRHNGKLEDIQAIFPHFNRWSVAYDLIFTTPLGMVEKHPAKLILTSTQGTASFDFLPITNN